jgi:hypothetical protein
MADRDLSAVGKAGFRCGMGLTVYHSDLVAELGQVVGRAHTEQAATEDEYFHLKPFDEGSLINRA